MTDPVTKNVTFRTFATAVSTYEVTTPAVIDLVDGVLVLVQAPVVTPTPDSLVVGLQEIVFDTNEDVEAADQLEDNEGLPEEISASWVPIAGELPFTVPNLPRAYSVAYLATGDGFIDLPFRSTVVFVKSFADATPAAFTVSSTINPVDAGAVVTVDLTGQEWTLTDGVTETVQAFWSDASGNLTEILPDVPPEPATIALVTVDGASANTVTLTLEGDEGTTPSFAIVAASGVGLDPSARVAEGWVIPPGADYTAPNGRRSVFAYRAITPNDGIGVWTNANRIVAGIWTGVDPLRVVAVANPVSGNPTVFPAISGLATGSHIVSILSRQDNTDPYPVDASLTSRILQPSTGFNRIRLSSDAGTELAERSVAQQSSSSLIATIGLQPAGDALVADWYVTTDGSDSNAGTSEAAAFATWQAAFNAASAGDVIAIKGGTYTLPSSYTWAQAGFAIVDAPTNGTSLNKITVKSYAGRAVLDFSQVPSSAYAYGFMPDGDHWVFENLDFTGIRQDIAAHFMVAVGTEGGAVGQQWNGCRVYGNAGPGFYFFATQDTVFTNCDAFANRDALSGGGNSDGFAFVDGGTGNKWIRCRSWNNSDDGFDCWDTDNRIEIEECWAWSNGYAADGTTAAGDGNGFKLGRNTAGTRHLLTRCIAAENRVRGFDNNGSGGVHTLRHCAAYATGGRHSLGDYVFDTTAATVLQNCLSFSADVDLHANVTATTCSWTEATVTGADFAGVNVSQLALSRASGALPTIDFLRPVTGSDLIDAGTDIGLAFDGTAPDIGWVEVA